MEVEFFFLFLFHVVVEQNLPKIYIYILAIFLIHTNDFKIVYILGTHQILSIEKHEY